MPFMGPIISGYPAWEWAIAFAILGAGAVRAIYSLARSGSRRKRELAIAALCAQNGMRRVEDARSPFLPRMLPISEPMCHNTFDAQPVALVLRDQRPKGIQCLRGADVRGP